MRTKKLFTVLFSIIFIMSSTACFQSKPKQNVFYYNNTFVTDTYAKDLKGVINCEYEEIILGDGRDMVPGPTDYQYRGIIYLSQEEAKDIFDNYNWTEDTNFVCPDLGNVNTSSLNSDVWYSCNEFQKDMFQLDILYLRFNGKDKIIINSMTF